MKDRIEIKTEIIEFKYNKIFAEKFCIQKETMQRVCFKRLNTIISGLD